MQEKRGKIVSLFLVLSLLALSGNLYAKKKGAKLVVEKKDGQSVRGELIAVKNSSLLLLDSESGVDVSVDIVDIGIIKIGKKSKVWIGAGIGALVGGLFGLISAQSYIEHEGEPYSNWLYIGCFLVCGVPGGLVGALIGSKLGKDKTIQIEGKSDSEIKEALEDLRSKARVPDFQ